MPPGRLHPLLSLFVLFSLLLSACDSSGEEEVSVITLPSPQVIVEADYTVAESGLKYADLQVGSGAVAVSGDVVVVDYHAWFEDGQLFESTVFQGRPINFALGNGEALQGLDEGVTSMRVGGQRQLVIPPSLAYGENGFATIPPNATLIFEVELLAIQE